MTCVEWLGLCVCSDVLLTLCLFSLHTLTCDCCWLCGIAEGEKNVLCMCESVW